jgi:5-methylcytosine-specific restriction endonuclease McrA
MKFVSNRRHPGRSGAAWEAARKQVLANASGCWLCGKPLDFDAPPRSRWAPSVDHVLPLKAMRHLDPVDQRRLALDPSNLRPCHYGCNSGRGARRIARPRLTSRAW